MGMKPETSQIEFRVWWIPQIGQAPTLYKIKMLETTFYVPVKSIEEGKKICEVLAHYDLFQYENRIKPDYANTGGISMKHPTGTDGEWWDVPDDEEELQDILDHCV